MLKKLGLLIMLINNIFIMLISNARFSNLTVMILYSLTSTLINILVFLKSKIVIICHHTSNPNSSKITNSNKNL